MAIDMRKFRAFCAVVFATFVLVACGASSTGSGGSKQTPPKSEPASNLVFERMVQERLPGYRITPALIGKSYTVPKAFADSVANGRTPDVAFAEFVGRYENTGLRQVRLYDRTRAPGRSMTYWYVDFPGCQPGNCAAALNGLTYVRTTKTQYERYSWSIPGPIFKRQVAKAKVGEFTYRAELWAIFNRQSELLKYEIKFQRSARDDRAREIDWANKNRSGVSEPLIFLSFDSFPSLGVSELEYLPDPFRSAPPSARSLRN